MNDNRQEAGAFVDFGFRQVPREVKPRLVRAVFARVAERYDLMNDLMSLGIHRVWKRIFIARLRPRPSARLLDLAGGSGDISLGWLAAGGGPAVLSDVNPHMIGVARRRAREKGIGRGLSFVVSDAERLAFPDSAFDRVSIAFGLRNCTDKEAVLAVARRVLKPGGQFACLEFSRFQIAALAPLNDAWSFGVLPRLCAVVALDSHRYRYL
jgi:demethylmenaquinone methyltransferase/2-methoxy-6-polyprenyl-1,4-benzoquinol methylase